MQPLHRPSAEDKTMPDLLMKPTQRGAAPDKAQATARKGWQSWNSGMAALAGNTARTVASESLVAGNYPSVAAAVAPARKAAPDLLATAPAHVQALAKRTGPEGGQLLALIAKRSAEEGGGPIDFTTADAASVMGVPDEHAERIVRHMLQVGILTPRTGPLGNRAGYAITATGL